MAAIVSQQHLEEVEFSDSLSLKEQRSLIASWPA
jgi:hypothetical protein